MKCLTNTGGKKSIKEDFLVKVTWTYFPAPERSLLFGALQTWAATPTGLTIACTCTFDLSLYYRFSQMFSHSPFKFLLQLIQSSLHPLKYGVLQMKVLYVIPSYWSFEVQELPLWRICHIRDFIIFLQKFQKQLVRRCRQSSFGSMGDSGSAWTSFHWVNGRGYQNQDTKAQNNSRKSRYLNSLSRIQAFIISFRF